VPLFLDIVMEIVKFSLKVCVTVRYLNRN
jgi:hypothetical protein